MKILIFGGSGFLGTKLKKMLSQKGHQVKGVDIGGKSDFKLDATNFDSVLELIKKTRPDVVVDTIALTSSIECEKNPEKAMELNYKTAKNISEACNYAGSKMIFISSSYIFDGKKGNYSEDDLPSPFGVYAKTKIMAEKELMKNKNNVVFRVDLMYGYNGKNFPNGIFNKILLNKDFYVGNPHQIRSPLFIEDVPKIIERLCLSNEGGVFNLAGPDKLKMIDFLLKLENLIRKDSKIRLIENKKLLVPGKKDSSLNTSKIRKIGVSLTGIQEALKLIKKQLQ